MITAKEAVERGAIYGVEELSDLMDHIVRNSTDPLTLDLLRRFADAVEYETLFADVIEHGTLAEGEYGGDA